MLQRYYTFIVFSGYSLESDSETEGNLLYQISSTFSHMFSSGSENSEELTEDAGLSEEELDEEEQEGGGEEEVKCQTEAEQEIEEKKKAPEGVHPPRIFSEESHVTGLLGCLPICFRFFNVGFYAYYKMNLGKL